MTIQHDQDATEWPDAESGPAAATMRACEACNRKKTKCDMARPNCGLCRRTGRVCRFPTTRKLPRTSFKRTASNAQPLSSNLTWLLSFLGETDDVNLAAKQDRLLAAMSEGIQPPSEDSAEPAFALEDFRQRDMDTAAQPYDSNVIPPDLQFLNALRRADDDQPFDPEINPTGCDSQAETDFSPKVSDRPATCMPCVSYDLAMDLIDTFFIHIQPWLPLLHKPRFIARCEQELKPGSDSLASLSLEMALLLTGMFGLAARFSSNPVFQDLEPLERDSQYIVPARSVYSELRNTRTSSLSYLQGCIVLAFHAYTDELNSSAWILSGVCVRLAYDLELSEIDGDDANSAANQTNYDHIDLEEMRRAWWLTWELDTFGSLMTRKPFAVDRHHFTVRLPLSDSDWFAGRAVESAELLTLPEQSWKSLQESENQNPRAWFLIANHLLSLLIQHMYKRHSDFSSTMSEFASALNCMKLSWPSSFDILMNPPRFEPYTFADLNWVLGTHLMLMTAYSLLDSAAKDGGGISSPMSAVSQASDGRKSLREVSFTQLVMRWPPDYMVAAHPFFICNVMPTNFESGGPSKTKIKASYDAVGDAGELVIARFAEKWKLAGQALTVFRVLRNSLSEADADSDLRRRFAAFFGREPASRFHHSDRKLLHNSSPSCDRVPRPDLDITQNYEFSAHNIQLGGQNELLDPHRSAQAPQHLQDQETSPFTMTPSMMMPHMTLTQANTQASPFSFSEILGHAPEPRDVLY